ASILARAFIILAGIMVLENERHKTELADQRLQELEKEKEHRSALAALEDKVRKKIAEGEIALDAHDWSKAAGLLSEALESIGSEPSLEAERQKATRLREASQRGLGAEKRFLEAHGQFKKRFQEALLYQSQITGSDRAKNVERVRTTARAALALFGLDDAARTIPDLDDSPFDRETRREIVSDCYVLLLTLAEATSQPVEAKGEKVPEQAEKALALLDRALKLRGTPTKAYHLRRAAYLARGGRKQEANAEIQKADALQAVDAVDYFLVGEGHF